MAVVGSFVIGRIAPAGQTSERGYIRDGSRAHGHFRLHQPCQVGRGRSTWLGHTATHSWQTVQCCAKLRALNDPRSNGGGTGIFLSSDDGQSAVYFPLAPLERRWAILPLPREMRAGYHPGPVKLLYIESDSGGYFRSIRFMTAVGVGDGSLSAFIQAVHACHQRL